jgi:predicted phosphoadenosine phosphosulfate sulfurtransferase
MSKLYLNIDVYQAARRRIAAVFADFANIIVAFSGGKDSGLLLRLAMQHAQESGDTRKLSLLHLDYEAQYTATTDYVDATFSELADLVIPYRCCVPFKAATCTSMHQDHWRPWDDECRDLWVRPIPEQCRRVEEFDFYRLDMWDYEFQDRFGEWHRQRHGGTTCVLIGIRAQESLNRWRTITSGRNINKHRGLPWTTVMGEGVCNAYPLYDWSVEDVWTAYGRFGWPYNGLYDLFYRAGVPLHQQRVASPFNSAAGWSLHLYRAIDPDVWGRMVSRVNGVNFTAIYGGTTAMGWRKITKPAHLTWKEYMLFLLDTLPPEAAASYRDKLETSIKFWRQRGGVLSAEAIADLRTAGIEFEVGGQTNYKTDKLPVRMEYADDIDSASFSLIPTYKRMCVCILKNDHLCKYMGFSLNKNEMERRKAALEKYKDI